MDILIETLSEMILFRDLSTDQIYDIVKIAGIDPDKYARNVEKKVKALLDEIKGDTPDTTVAVLVSRNVSGGFDVTDVSSKEALAE